MLVENPNFGRENACGLTDNRKENGWEESETRRYK
jgi:hypothetical protein